MDHSTAQALADALPAMPAGEAFARGVTLLNADHPELLLPAAGRLSARHPGDARLAQLAGLAARAAGDGPGAWRAFARAARLAPHDPLIAHSHARTALEAGRPAVALYQLARRLAPADGSVLQGLAAALTAEGRANEALALLGEALAASPLWLDGHRSFARIAAQFGADPVASLDTALAAHPANGDLHQLKILTSLEARAADSVSQALAAAGHALGGSAWLTRLAAHAASERGDPAADALFAAAPAPTTAAEASLAVRHLVKAARPDQALAIADRWLASPGDEALWPYRALAWRMLDDDLARWLEGDGGLVGIYDLARDIAGIAGLVDELRALHVAKAPPIDQSVRGGTQTDGNLLLRDSPAIQALRRVILAAVARHITALPAPRLGHPTLIARRAPLRIAGAWSVRLTGAGYHQDHVHPEGWFSSALYLALPEPGGREPGSDRHAGWLQLGTSRLLTPSLLPTQRIEPKFGRLVLFPSTMWHGTLPFVAGERLTVAFDIARPRQAEARQ